MSAVPSDVAPSAPSAVDVQGSIPDVVKSDVAPPPALSTAQTTVSGEGVPDLKTNDGDSGPVSFSQGCVGALCPSDIVLHHPSCPLFTSGSTAAGDSQSSDQSENSDLPPKRTQCVGALCPAVIHHPSCPLAKSGSSTSDVTAADPASDQLGELPQGQHSKPHTVRRQNCVEALCPVPPPPSAEPSSEDSSNTLAEHI